jgi:hypothetical protein
MIKNLKIKIIYPRYLFVCDLDMTLKIFYLAMI